MGFLVLDAIFLAPFLIFRAVFDSRSSFFARKPHGKRLLRRLRPRKSKTDQKRGQRKKRWGRRGEMVERIAPAFFLLAPPLSFSRLTS